MTAIAEPLRLATAEAYLGPADRRFFGDGYRRSSRKLSDLTLISAANGAGQLTAVARVDYPADWSRKGSRDQPPHLSTVDVIALAQELISLYLPVALNISPTDPNIRVVGSLRISAGNTAVEDALGAFPVQLTAQSSRLPEAPVRETRFTCEIGTLRLTVTMRHPDLGPCDATVTVASSAELDLRGGTFSTCRRPFATGWTGRRNTITDVYVDRESYTAMAKSRHSPVEPDLRTADLIVDAFAVTLQLGQILLYEMDALGRTQSNTLWMRQTSFHWTDTEPSGSGDTRVYLDKARILNRGGRQWRVADIVGAAYGVAARCSVAHELPA